MRWRDPNDREIWALAIPAFGALIAEPLYVLLDTAIIGQLGTHPLGGLAIAGTVLTAAFGVFNFLAYGTTAAVARSTGARQDRAAAEHGVAGIWLATGLGVVLTILGLCFAEPIVDAMGASDDIRPHALTYLRIGLLGAPFLLIALAGTGYLRGRQNTRMPLAIAVVANTVNVALDLVLIYGFDLGLAGSAWGTVVAQIGAAIAYLVAMHRHMRPVHASWRPVPAFVREAARVGGQLTVRTAALLLAFLTTTAIASRLGDVQLAAHQIAWQLWYFLALALDAIAIAGQAIVGRYLGAADPQTTRATARRMIEWGVVVGAIAGAALFAVQPLLAAAFTDDAAVRDQFLDILWAVALMQPVAAVVFVLDGILIGAGETRYLAVAMVGATCVFLPAALLVQATDRGLLALWGAVWVFIGARLIGMWWRYRTDVWLVTGATRT